MKLRRSLFWDVNPDNIDLEKNARYVIERVLEDGNDEEVREVWHKYGKHGIAIVARESKTLTPRSRTFWMLMTQDQNN